MRGPALRQHLLGVALAVLVVALLTWWLVRERATEQAEAAAADKVRALALSLALPLTSEHIADDDEWIEHLSAAAEPQLESGEILTVHIWRRIDHETGEIVWSTAPAKRGSVVPLGGAQVALDTGEPVVEKLLDGRDSEGPALPNLYEVYLPFTDATGEKYVLEVYKPVLEYDEIRSGLLRDWLLVSVLGVLFLGAITLPLSLRLARAVGEAERDRALYADRALRARAEEHQRIAEVLHERTVQDLAAVRLMLDTIRDLPASEEAERVLEQTSDMLDLDVRELRVLLTGGEGTEWQADDLATALRGWVDTLPDPELVSCDLPAELISMDPQVVLAFRIIKEAVRNAIKHADATTVRVRVRLAGGDLIGEVVDDGRGSTPAPRRDSGRASSGMPPPLPLERSR